MRLSELLGVAVITEDGDRLGSVVDVLAVQDGPIPGGGVDASWRVEGLVVGRDAIGVRLGFHRSGIRGPWPLRTVLNALDRRCVLVGWEQIRDRGRERIVVAGAAGDYPPPPRLDAGGLVETASRSASQEASSTA